MKPRAISRSVMERWYGRERRVLGAPRPLWLPLHTYGRVRRGVGVRSSEASVDRVERVAVTRDRRRDIERGARDHTNDGAAGEIRRQLDDRDLVHSVAD